MYQKKLRNKGFTLTEILISILISSIVLVGFYQLSFSSVRFFTYSKNESDNLETKTPSMELLARYFDRWGVGVITDTNSSDEKTLLPKTEKYIYAPTNADSSAKQATESDPIIFYANLSGIGFVKSVGTNANLLSCRLGETTVGSNTNNDKCYYILRDNKIIPNNLNSDNDVGTTPNTSLYNKPLYDSISFATTPTSSTECVSDSLFANINTSNSNIDKQGTIVDSNSSSILSILFQGLTTTASTVNLMDGDIIFRSPHRIKLFIKSNPLDSNKNWLYVNLTPIASKCASNGGIVEEPIAPADSITAKKLGTSSAYEIKVTFRSNEYKKQSKTFTVTRIFGG